MQYVFEKFAVFYVTKHLRNIKTTEKFFWEFCEIFELLHGLDWCKDSTTTEKNYY